MFKRFLILSSHGPPVQWSGTIYAILNGRIIGNIHVVLEEMSYKDISSLELKQPLFSVEWNHLCNIERRYHEEQSCKIILNLDQWFRRKCCLKVILSGALTAFC